MVTHVIPNPPHHTISLPSHHRTDTNLSRSISAHPRQSDPPQATPPVRSPPQPAHEAHGHCNGTPRPPPPPPPSHAQRKGTVRTITLMNQPTHTVTDPHPIDTNHKSTHSTAHDDSWRRPRGITKVTPHTVLHSAQPPTHLAFQQSVTLSLCVCVCVRVPHLDSPPQLLCDSLSQTHTHTHTHRPFRQEGRGQQCCSSSGVVGHLRYVQRGGGVTSGLISRLTTLPPPQKLERRPPKLKIQS
jgi:hypothetical protein